MMTNEELLAAFDAQLEGMPVAPKAAPKARYAVVFSCRFTGETRVVGTFTSRKRASSAADRKDLAYGSYAHHVRMV
jgi:hypothetical protein